MKFVVDGILRRVEGEEENVKIPEGVREIDDNVFKGHTEIKKIELPDSLEKIGENTFEGCTNLTSITFSKNLKTIGYQTFFRCSKLTKLSLPANLKELGDFAFEDCENLKEVNLPDSLEVIGNRPFKGCKNLKIKLLSNQDNLKHPIQYGNTTKIYLSRFLEEFGIGSLILSPEDQKHIIKFHEETDAIVFNYKLFYPKQDICPMIFVLS